MMTATETVADGSRFGIQSSKRVRWDIDEDVIRGRRLNAAHKFLPDGLSLADAFTTLSADEQRFVSQIQGRTYANIFGLVEQFINAKVLELSHQHALGDQEAVEALGRFSDEELKHQELFRRVEPIVGKTCEKSGLGSLASVPLALATTTASAAPVEVLRSFCI
jgi:hypothetical protein